MFPAYTRSEIEKLGNAIVFLAERIKPLSKTKLLKLVYLIEEISVKKSGTPFFNLQFDVWKLGPVSRDLFIELSDGPQILKDYIRRTTDNDSVYIEPRKSFVDDEFSDNEIEILELVVKQFKDSSSAELIELTHRKHSPWYITAKNEGVLDLFEQGLANSTDIAIDLSLLLQNDESKLAFYEENRLFLQNSKHLKF